MTFDLFSTVFCLGFTVYLFSSGVDSFPEPGKWTLKLNSTYMYDGVSKNMFKATKIYVRVRCTPEATSSRQKVIIGWILRETKCWNDFAYLNEYGHEIFSTYYHKPEVIVESSSSTNSTRKAAEYVRLMEDEYECGDTIYLNAKPVASGSSSKSRSVVSPEEAGKKKKLINTDAGPSVDEPQYIIEQEGVYLFVIHIRGAPDSTFWSEVDLRMECPFGYLSVVDWPLLPFYGVMCGIYVCMGLGWLVVCAMHWRDLLRIQFWIGGVIFLGMLEKAMFYAEFQNINSTGSSTKGLIFTAEIISCAKRTLARMLVIIVSLGFGIVKPRLGPTLHRVLGIGGLYFVLAGTEAYLRILKPKNDLSTPTLVAGIPLAAVDSTICWWVFSGLAQTVRTLRLRRNLVKLSVYRHFTHVLVFAVVASIVFMLVNIKFFKLEECLTEWRWLWVDEAFWHLQFSILLLCIMFLWTPSKNNQRYAFTPLLDYDVEDEDNDNNEDEFLITDAYDGMKQRLHVMKNGKASEAKEDGGANPEDNPLKWVEENIPETAETSNPLPVIDSDEEIETTRFEISKMQ